MRSRGKEIGCGVHMYVQRFWGILQKFQRQFSRMREIPSHFQWERGLMVDGSRSNFLQDSPKPQYVCMCCQQEIFKKI